MVELESYKSSLATLENMVVLPQGSLTRRPGTFFAATTKANGAARLIPFSRGQGTSLVLEFGNLYIRFFANDGPVRTDDISATYSQSTNTVTVTKSSHGYSASDEVYLDFTSGNGVDGFYTIATVADANTFTVTSTTSQTTSGNVNISQRFEVTTTYTASQVNDIAFTQSADVLFLVHPDHVPARLERNATNSWALTNLLPSVISGTYTRPATVLTDGPFKAMNTTDTTLTVALAANSEFSTTIDDSTQSLSLEEVGTVSPSNVDVTTNAFTLSNHPLVNGQKVQFTGGDGITKTPVTGTYGQSGTTVTVTKSSHGYANSSTVHLDFTSGAGVDGFHTITSVADANTFTVTSGTSQTISAGEAVTISTRLATATDFFVVSATQNTFKLATTAGGTPLDLARAPDTEDMTISKSFVDKDKYLKVTASAITGINDDTGFQTTDVGRYIRLNTEIAPQIKHGYGEIVERTSTTVVLVQLKTAIAGVGATTEWQLGSFSGTTGYPRTVQLYQQRLVFAGTAEESQTIFLSKTADFFNFSATEPLGQQTGQRDSAGRSIVGEQIFEDAAISLTISSDTVDQIEWMSEDQRLTIGTSGGIYQLYGSSDDLTLTPFNFSITKVSAWSCDPTALPAKVGNNLLYVQNNGRKLRELAFDKLQDQYSAADLTLRSEDISESGLIATAYQDQPYSVLWCLRNDGRLAGLTYVDLLQMRAWHRHTIGGAHYDDTHGAQAKVESIASIPRGTHDQLYMIVKRHLRAAALTSITFNQTTDKFTKSSHGLANGTTVVFDSTTIDGFTADKLYYVVSTATNDFQLSESSGGAAVTVSGSTSSVTVSTLRVVTEKRYVEFLERYFVASEILPSDAHFVDSGLEEPPTRTSASTAVSALDHLEGESVAILADAAVQPDRTVSSGAITLQTAATNFRVGFAYNSDIKSLPMVAMTGQGTSVGNRKRIHRFTVRLLESLSFKFGTNANDLDAATIAYLESLGLNFGVNISDLTAAVFRTASDNIGSALSFFTGEKTFQVGDQFSTITQLFLRQDQPYPFSVTLLAIDYQTNE